MDRVKGGLSQYYYGISKHDCVSSTRVNNDASAPISIILNNMTPGKAAVYSIEGDHLNRVKEYVGYCSMLNAQYSVLAALSLAEHSEQWLN